MASIEPVEFTCKDGRKAGLRTPVPDDAQAVWDYAKVNMEDGVGSITLPEEFTLTVEEESEWLARHLEHPNDLAIVAELDGQIVGLLNFHAERRKRLKHGGGFGVSVHPDWRELGIGRAMIKALLVWARAHPGIVRVGLAVIADNDRAIALYRKLGFKEEGRRVEYVNYGDRRVDDILMYVMV